MYCIILYRLTIQSIERKSGSGEGGNRRPVARFDSFSRAARAKDKNANALAIIVKTKKQRISQSKDILVKINSLKRVLESDIKYCTVHCTVIYMYVHACMGTSVSVSVLVLPA